MKSVFEINGLESELKYIQLSAPTVFERIQSELETGDTRATDFKNRLIASKAVLEAFGVSGEEAIIVSEVAGVPIVRQYLTKGVRARIDGKYKVVDSGCFMHCPSLETVVFDEGVEYINECVLCDNSLITSIVFPQTLKSVGDHAFRNCGNLGQVVFRNPKTWIAPDAFEGTKWFSRFEEEFVVVNGQLLKYNGNSEIVRIPEGTIYVSHQVFNENQAVKQVICPSTLEGIGTYAFAACPNLSEVRFNEELGMICIAAFEDCPNLKEVHLPPRLRELGAQAFGKRTVVRFYDTNKQFTEYIEGEYPNAVIVRQ